MRFIDSGIFIYHLAGDERYGETASRIMERISRGEEATTSTLVLSQVIAYLRWKKRSPAISLFIGFLRSTPTIHKIETTFSDIVSAQKIQDATKAGWETWDDLVIAAQMSRIGINEIYSNDRDFDTLPKIKRVFR